MNASNKTMNFYEAMEYLKNNKDLKVSTDTHSYSYLMFDDECLWWYYKDTEKRSGQLQITRTILEAQYTFYDTNNKTFEQLKDGEYFEYPVDKRIYRKLKSCFDANTYLVSPPTVAKFEYTYRVKRLPYYKEQ